MQQLEKIVLGLVILIGGGLVYSHIVIAAQLRVLNERTDQCCYPAGSIGEALRTELEHQGTKNESAESYRAQLIRETLTKNHQTAETQLSYLEFLVEGLARREKLPIERARAHLAQELDIPAGWTWPSNWEKAAPEPEDRPALEEEKQLSSPQKSRPSP